MFALPLEIHALQRVMQHLEGHALAMVSKSRHICPTSSRFKRRRRSKVGGSGGGTAKRIKKLINVTRTARVHVVVMLSLCLSDGFYFVVHAREFLTSLSICLPVQRLICTDWPRSNSTPAW